MKNWQNYVGGAASVRLGLGLAQPYEKQVALLLEQCNARARAEGVSVSDALDFIMRERLIGQCAYACAMTMCLAGSLALAFSTDWPSWAAFVPASIAALIPILVQFLAAKR